MERNETSRPTPSRTRRQLGDIPAATIAMIVSLLLLLGVVAGCDALIFSR